MRSHTITAFVPENVPFKERFLDRHKVMAWYHIFTRSHWKERVLEVCEVCSSLSSSMNEWMVLLSIFSGVVSRTILSFVTCCEMKFVWILKDDTTNLRCPKIRIRRGYSKLKMTEIQKHRVIDRVGMAGTLYIECLERNGSGLNYSHSLKSLLFCTNRRHSSIFF